MGVGSIGIQTPLYPGAKQNQFQFIPFPFGIYRGEYFRADDEGTRARLLKPRAYELGLSFGFNFAVDSEETNLRKGMPSLDTILQVGPRFLYRFLTENPNQRLNLSLAVRAAFATNFRSRFRETGLTILPEVGFWNRFPEYRTTFYTYLNFAFASDKFNGYFYDVQNRFATGNRAQYDARSGLLTTALGVGFSKDITDDILIFTGGSYRNLDWAANNNSPLVETRENLSFILGILWIFYESDEKVKTIRPKMD
ncbi:MAG: MipA/OmpV family protein [Bdellovibrionales bacterium]|nr:MipA/OmpV family protein [Bdellovibrionales bacterium]NQZ17957.1 MipA/OmpV family protein [Bdellovibrionales bacterium]